MTPESSRISISTHLPFLLVLSAFLNLFKWLVTVGLIMSESRDSFWNLGICQEQNWCGGQNALPDRLISLMVAWKTSSKPSRLAMPEHQDVWATTFLPVTSLSFFNENWNWAPARGHEDEQMCKEITWKCLGRLAPYPAVVWRESLSPAPQRHMECGRDWRGRAACREELSVAWSVSVFSVNTTTPPNGGTAEISDC